MQGSRIDVVKSEAGLDRWVGFLMKEVMASDFTGR